MLQCLLIKIVNTLMIDYIRYTFYMRKKLGIFNQEKEDVSLIKDLLEVKIFLSVIFIFIIIITDHVSV